MVPQRSVSSSLQPSPQQKSLVSRNVNGYLLMKSSGQDIGNKTRGSGTREYRVRFYDSAIILACR